MKQSLYFDAVSETFLTKTTNATDEERLNFLEAQIRRIQLHEPMCDTILIEPEYGKINWWKRTIITKKASCDCWLSKPFGSVGLSGNYS